MINKYLAWKHKREILVSNSLSVEFLGSLLLPYFPGMRYDFRDIRAADERGTAIPLYIESVTEFSSAFVWFKLPANTEKFFLYYGNGAVLSASSGADVFDFWDDFLGSSINTSVWNVGGSGGTVSGSVLTMQHAYLSGYIESKTTFAPNSLVEIRASHQSGQRGPLGFRNISTEKAAAWQGAAGSLKSDHKFAHNGSSGDWDNDGVDRSGAFHVYGVAHIAAGPKYYVDYTYRGQITTTIPGAVNLPVHVYAYYGEGYVKADWVRVRKYQATEPVLTLGKKSTNQPKSYPFFESVDAATVIENTPGVIIKSFMSGSTQVSMKSGISFRQPMFYEPRTNIPLPAWKYQGEIELYTEDSPARIFLPILPGMTTDGRDLRFRDKAGNELSYNVETVENDQLKLWVEFPAGADRIAFFYGNGLAEPQSDPEIVGTPDIIQNVTPHFSGGVAGFMPAWKYQGEIILSGAAAEGEQVLIEVARAPGMTTDGRDLRFTAPDRTSLSYYIESETAEAFHVWIKLIAGLEKIIYYYGNGLAVSESSAPDVFDFIDDFETIDTGEWSVLAGSMTSDGDNAILGSTTQNTIARTNSTFGPGHIIEMRMYHPNQNGCICGFWSADNNRACWVGASGTNYNDHYHTHNGSANTLTSDGVNRSGTTFYKYGITYELGSIGFYVDDEFRATLTTTTPSGSLPISLYSTVNKGNIVIDWVRVRKISTLTASIGKRTLRSSSVYFEEVTEYEAEPPNVIRRHYPRGNTPIVYYEYIAPQAFTYMQPSDPTFRVRRELKDYSIGAIEVSKSISETYLQLSTTFVDLVYPPEGATIKHNAYDSLGVPHLIFSGKIVAYSPTFSPAGVSVEMQAADLSRNLSIQKVPWNFQVVDGEAASFPSWIESILDPEETGVYVHTMIDTKKEPKQFVFDPKTTRLEAIQEIAAYAGCMTHVKLITREINGETVTRPEFYLVPPANIDQSKNGFDLPDPLTLEYPEPSLAGEPQVSTVPEEKYNKVTVYGVLSETGETVVASAISPLVYIGDEKPREYRIEDNSITEKGSTAEREAIKWLLYFLTPRAKVSMKFMDRFDFELYQRVRFGEGFPQKLRELTDSVQVPYVAAYDPRDKANSMHTIDVSGVPRPEWLRVSEIKYYSEHAVEYVEITAITDFIYSNNDPVVPAPYSDYLSPGYLKPSIDDLIDTTQSIVEDNIQKQLTPESCTVLSIADDGKSAVVQTASGKIVTVQLA